MPRPSSRRPGPSRLALALVVLAGCQAPITSPSSSPGGTIGPTPRPTPTAVPTPAVSPAPAPTDGGGLEPAELVVRVTRCTEICEPTPGTTVLADGRIIWEGPERRVQAARLTRAGLDRVREEIEAREELAVDGDHQARLRPGAEPFPRGTSTYRFEVGPGDPRIVTSGDPDDYAAEADLWIIPPAMERLAELARRLLEPVAWLGPDALVEPAGPHAPTRFLVLVELFPGISDILEFDADLADIASPFGAPLDLVGEPLPQPDGTFPIRCLVTDAGTARRLAAAEVEAGGPRNLEQWSSAIGYGWRRGQGFAQVTVTQVLPHQVDPCAEVGRF